ncbi:MAG: CotH kinase family protein [Paludibacteraceae bacterium]|nr:CotH kinase family protein [Paludibacteraceae bacterium]
MMKKHVLLVSLLLFCVTIRGQLVINELMQSNIDCIMDDLNEFPDSWVELYNTTAQDVSLSDYAIGVKASAKKAYSLPEQTIPANGYVVIYCDKEEQGLHADFRLESGKDGCVYLFKNGTPIDSLVAMKKQPAPNIAYGRKTDGADDWGYQAVPTPGQTNCGKVYKKCLDNPVITPRGQVLTSKQNIQITISLPEGAPDNAVIRYTLDGSEPQANSLVYAAPLNVDTTTILRAKLFADGYLSPRSTTESYIYLNREMTLPVLSIVTNDDYFYDTKIGIYVEGDYTPGTPNYTYNWRRPCNFELFDSPLSESSLNQLCETRVHGGASRARKLRSLDLYANKRFGEKRFDYEFFPDQKPGLTNFKSITLRNAGNDFHYLYMRDAVIQRTMGQHADIDWQAYKPTIIFINGKYKGIINIRERSNEDYVYSNYNELEDITMVENYYELKSGNQQDWVQFRNFFHTQGHSYEEYDQIMDCEEIMNVYGMNIYFNNLDFPANNVVLWCPEEEQENLPKKWRMVAKDTDYGLGIYDIPADYDYFRWLYDNQYDPDHSWGNVPQHTEFIRYALEDSIFRHRFIDKLAIYMGDFMNNAGITAMVDSMVEAITYEYPHHAELYGLFEFEMSQEIVKNWLGKRDSVMYVNMGNFYHLGSPIPMTISIDSSSLNVQELQLMFNQITLSKPSWNGQFYANRPIQIVASNQDEALQDAAWKITYTKDNTEYNQVIEGRTCQWEIPDNCSSVRIILCDKNTTSFSQPNIKEHIRLTKQLENNKVVIIRNNKRYSVLGNEIR